MSERSHQSAAEPELVAFIESAALSNPPKDVVLERLEREHGITTHGDLIEVLEDATAAAGLPTLWRLRFTKLLASSGGSPTSREEPAKTIHRAPSNGLQRDEADSRSTSYDDIARVVGGEERLRWRPRRDGNGPLLLVMKGDLTACRAEGIVNAANSHLAHGGGLAGAIVRNGGHVIQMESDDWIARHGSVPVGSAMSTSAGRLPCRFVIHTVGPSINSGRPSGEQARLLRSAVWKALLEAAKLGLTSVAVPGISTGIFGYPLDLGAAEITNECVRFCRERSTTPLRTIILMNIDDKTVNAFSNALRETARQDGTTLELSNATSALKDAAISSRHGDGEASSVDPEQKSRRQSLSKSAGVLMVRESASGFEVLLGVEYRPFDDPPGRFVNFLGGKEDFGEQPIDTAAREFSEEVGGILQKPQVRALLSDPQRSRELFVPFAKYMLFIATSDNSKLATLPEKYAKKKKSHMMGHGAEHDLLLWVSWAALVAAVDKTPSSPSIETPRGRIELSKMLTRFMSDHRVSAELRIEQLLVGDIIERERQRLCKLHSLSDDELIAALLQDDWKLQLSSPPIPPPPPITTLNPNVAEYKTVLNALPSEMASRVVNIRSVRASARVGDYKAELKRLKSQPKATVSEQSPLFHGTPERWRATAIALNGFDLNIRLVGRIFGDGVYSSTSTQEAHGYSRGTGSLLRLDAIVASNCQNKADETVRPTETMHVFPNPKCVLPRFIIDFAAPDSKDSIESQRNSAQEEYRQMLEKRKALVESMKTKEAEFTRDMGKRLRNALQVYVQNFNEFETRFNSVDADENGSDSRMELIRQFCVERQQFAKCLPMYEAKPEVIRVLRANVVTILVADTGSGKSTQLPQLLLDHIFSANETRRIAVLQPRRVNAISLSRRVAEERGLPPGQEVGFTIGRGESDVTETTRIEFMTHGLFVQLARDPDRLLARYCAVIVDEAHERSVDVDLSLALLKRVLNQLDTHNEDEDQYEGVDLRFRVVVTSATIEGEAEHFQKYLDPTKQASAILRVHGRTFPVHIEHRSDCQVDRNVVGSSGVGKILTSAAIQTAMDILKTTEAGSILIFLPGEGSIKDALDIARQDILQASGATETVDTDFGGHSSSSFCFRLRLEIPEDKTQKSGRTSFFGKKKRPTKTITACILGFHGKITRAERDQVLNPAPDRRFVIFSTNVAETGVTLPNVRYVVDTGLERRVRWNPASDVNEMVTEPVTMSSLKQRAGRAGRTSSGICIRLYPECRADVCDEGSPELLLPGQHESEPAVLHSMIYKAVLLDKHMQEKGGEGLELLDPIDPSKRTRAEERLHELGALDDEGRLTREGEAQLALGIDLRQGRLLIACSRFGCLATGAKLVALLMSSDGPERILPERRFSNQSSPIEEYIDPSGDHLTLLNLLLAFEAAQDRSAGLAWCQRHRLDIDVFLDAQTSFEYLLKVLEGLHFSLKDEDDRIKMNGGLGSSIRRALCAAYYDHLARARAPGSTKDGYIRVLDDAHANGSVDMMTDFAGRTQPNDANGAAANMANPDEAIVRATSRTTLWLDKISNPPDVSESPQLVVFGSMMLTDGSRSSIPTVQLITYVSEEEVAAGAPDWCRMVDFKELLHSSAREMMRFPVDSNVRKIILAGRGRWLSQLRRKFPSIVAKLEADAVVISCPLQSYARVDTHVRKLLRDVEPESVTLRLPEHVKMGNIIGKGGIHRKALEDDIQELLASERCGAGSQHVRSGSVLHINGETREITVTLDGAAKALMPVIIGRIQSLIVKTHGESMLPLVTDASGERGQQMQQCPRLTQLANSVPPSSWSTRDDLMLQFAHAIVWRCNANIYGGFLRDWVVRGETANDIDVQLSPQQTVASIQQALQQFVSESNHARQLGVRMSQPRTKGSAQAIDVRANGIESFDIDLVDPQNIKRKMHPGVDCDAGNLMISQSKSLFKKVDVAGGSLCSALEHVRKKQFDFFYDLATNDAGHNTEALRRLVKYLDRGWTCLTSIPPAVQARLSDSQRQLIQPNAND